MIGHSDEMKLIHPRKGMEMSNHWDITSVGGVFTPVTPSAISAHLDLDRSFFGTPDYQGFAHFWAHHYRHQLRDASPYQRRLVHKRLCLAGLPLDGVSDQHDEIINKVCGR